MLSPNRLYTLLLVTVEWR